MRGCSHASSLQTRDGSLARRMSAADYASAPNQQLYLANSVSEDAAFGALPTNAAPAAGRRDPASLGAPAGTNALPLPEAADRLQALPSGGPRATHQVSGGPCVECNATRSTLFRKNAEGLPLCNACGLRYSRHMAKQQAAAARQRTDAEFHPESDAVRSKTARAQRTGSPKKQRRRLPPDEQRWCRQCGATSSPQWRYVNDDLACNACALRQQRRMEREGKDVRTPEPACLTVPQSDTLPRQSYMLVHSTNRPYLHRTQT